MNEFQDRYRKFDNQKLLKIIEEAEKYEPQAVEAAKLELSQREVSDEEIQSVKDEVIERKVENDKQQKQAKKIGDKARDVGTKLFQTISPIHDEPISTKRKINFITIVFGLVAMYQIFSELGMVYFMFTDNLAEWDVSMVFYFVPLIIMIIGVGFFWKRRKLGWILMTSFFVYSIVGTIGVLSLYWDMNSGSYFDTSSSEGIQVDLESVINFYQPDQYTYLGTIAIYGGALWMVCKPDIRHVFQIDKKITLITIGTSLIISLLMLGII